MMFPWSKARHRQDLLAQPMPAQWRRYLSALSLYPHLTASDQQKLEDGTRILIAEKSWEGCNGLLLTDEIKVTIAGLASLLVLGFDHDYYPNVETILVYPDGFLVSERRVETRGVFAEQILPLSGQAALQGPVIISWADVRHGSHSGHNVVLHEFAHKLDMRDGVADGAPYLENDTQIANWSRVMSAEYQSLVERTQAGERDVLDPYGATNAAEFFAVITESFFERPRALQETHSELYGVLRDFYRQDPAALVARHG
ncbi:MAG: zinc-dependent peptidase [Janthinobacterium lividum]